ncbi:MAG: type III-B CRISPR module RAMP protein Cmr1, partial [Candidatus Kryptonium sp.]
VGLASLWLAIYLGGFGTRARRGGGNIQVVNEIKEFDGFSFKVAGRNADEVARWIVSNFEKVFSFVKRDKTRSIANTYSNVSQSRFIIAKNHKGNWVEALNEIGEMYLFFRKKHRKRVFELGAFGIPVVYSSRGKLVSTKSGRRSSPLIFKVVESEGKYYWMVIRLSGEFLPVDEKLRFGNRLVKPSYSLVDELWSDLKKIGDEHMFFKDSVEAREVARVIKY